MHANSSKVHSRQVQVHPRLQRVWQRHQQSPYQRPLSVHGMQAGAASVAWLARTPEGPLLLDTGCGTGASTLALAQRRPDARIIGIDQSAERLQRGSGSTEAAIEISERVLLLRAPLEDYWRLLLAAGVRPQVQYLWYPNPWPKPEHLMRRWHAHPVFSSVLALGGALELRSNWRLYIDEFAQVLAWSGRTAVIEPVPPDGAPVSPFERKYRDSGHELWRCVAADSLAAVHPCAEGDADQG